MTTSLANSVLRPKNAGVEVYAAVQKGEGDAAVQGGGGVRGGVGGTRKCRGYSPMHYKHRRRKVEKSCVTFLLCDPGWCVHKSDV